MSAPTLEPPVLTPVQNSMTLPDSMIPCQERRESAPSIPENWIARQLIKSYLSSFNLCLSELGWVPERILEVGCGDGTILSTVAQTFMDADVKGVEFDPDTVALASEKNCCRIEFSELVDGETLPYDDNAFDLVISHGFLGRTPLPRHWVQEMSRVSAEAVIVSFQTPLGYKWIKRFPGAGQAQLLGQPVFSSQVEPLPLRSVKSWMERQGLTVETQLSPLPFAMMLARKPQA